MSDGSRGRRGPAGQPGQSGQPQRFYFDDLAEDPVQPAPPEEAEPEPKFAPPPQPAPPERPLVVPVQQPAQSQRSSSEATRPAPATKSAKRPATPAKSPAASAKRPAAPTASPARPVKPRPPRAARDNDDDDLTDTGPIEVVRDPILGSAAAGQQLYFDDLAALPPAEPEPEPHTDEAVPAGSDEEPVRSALAVVAARRPRPVGAVLAVLVVLALIGVIAAVSGRGHGNKDTASVGTSHHTSASNGNPTASGEPTATGSATASAPAPKSRRTPTKQAVTPTDIPLTVLNNTIQHGLARSAAQMFSGRGWQIDNVGNYTGQISLTTVYYSPGSAAQHKAAETLAAEFPGVTQVQPRFASLPGSGLTVVLAPDWHL